MNDPFHGEMSISNDSSKHPGQYRTHERGDKHGGDQDDAGVLHKANKGNDAGEEQQQQEVEGEHGTLADTGHNFSHYVSFSEQLFFFILNFFHVRKNGNGKKKSNPKNNSKFYFYVIILFLN